MQRAKIILAVHDGRRNSLTRSSDFFTARCKTDNNTSRVQSALQFDNMVGTFIADVESCVVVGLIGDELDSHSRALADHALEWYLTAVTRVEEHNGASIQSAPQDQPARPELMDS